MTTTRARVLLVEDDRHVRKAVVRALQGRVDVVAFETLGEARPHVGEHWDGMIIDRRLPDGDGIEFAIGLKADDPSRPILVFSGDDPEQIAALVAPHDIVSVDKMAGIGALNPTIDAWVRAHEAAQKR